MKIKVQSVQYINDPDAAKQWFEIYVQIVKDEVLARQSKRLDPNHIIHQRTELGE